MKSFNFQDMLFICWLFSSIDTNKKTLFANYYREQLKRYGWLDGRSENDIKKEIDARIKQIDFEHKFMYNYNIKIHNFIESEITEKELNKKYSNFIKRK